MLHCTNVAVAQHLAPTIQFYGMFLSYSLDKLPIASDEAPYRPDNRLPLRLGRGDIGEDFHMRKSLLLVACAIGALTTVPVFAQEVPESDTDTVQANSQARAQAVAPPLYGEIVVTAQRQAERLQDVPIAVSAFSEEALDEQQINNALDLQSSLPNVVFSKSNFTTSSFTIRGVGDLCVGFSCDSATAVHSNDIPLLSTRLFETEYFDLERIEVLRGPQGTLFGRNATSGVVNVITAKPDLSGIHASGEAEYGNFNSIQVKGMVNVPLGDMFGVRLAGFYLNRDGYTKNLFDDSRIDDRDLYAIRGTLRFEPSPDTVLDIIGYYFHEDDNRSRIQKQLCNRDVTAILGCSPDRLEFETTNGNSTLGAALSSRQLFALQSLAQGGALGNFGISNMTNRPDIFAGTVNPTDLRTINTDFTPTYFAEEYHILGKFYQRIGQFDFTLGGGFTHDEVDSRVDYTLATSDPFSAESFARANAAAALFPNSVGSVLQNNAFCASDPDETLVGQFGGKRFGCSPRSTDFDRSRASTDQYSVEAKLSSDFDGPFNFLIGGIYVDQKTRNGDYFVVSTGIEYGSAVLGAAAAADGFFLAPPFYANAVAEYRLKSYGIFGEGYLELNDRLKLTLGARYSNDDKTVRSRSPILDVAGLIGTTSFEELATFGAYDADPATAGNQAFRETDVQFDDITGRAVLDFQVTPNNLLYASYSRGYKSGGVNPPVNPALNAPVTFAPENINAFEIGSKNTFAGGMFQLNGAAFYYDYSNLQISRILNRTSFNDNTDATIYGAEIEAIIRPTQQFTVNLGASYLKTKIKGLTLTDPRDPSGGRPDVTIIKDVASAANCVLIPTGGLSGDALVGVINGFLNAATGPANGEPLFAAGTTPVPGTNARGAISSCDLLTAAVAGGAPAPLNGILQGLFGPGPLPFQLDPASSDPLLPTGVTQDLTGNELPGAPRVKFSAGAQYVVPFDNGMSLQLRADLVYTGEYFARPQNSNIDRIQGYELVNAQVQLNGDQDKWFVRGFVQNLFDNNAITGQYLTDPSSGLFTNVFTVEPRRYGLAAGFKF